MATKQIEQWFEASIPASLERFGSWLDADWVDAALEQSGCATLRQRKLPNEWVVWLVVAMGMFRDRSIQEVVSHLGLVFSRSREEKAPQGRSIAASSLAGSRARVGSEPMQKIFRHTAQLFSQQEHGEHVWRGLSLYGIDGTTLRTKDSESNRLAFGLPATGSHGHSGYPQVKLVCLMGLRTHLICDAVFGACTGKGSNEQMLAQSLWALVPEDSLTVVDKGFLNYGALWQLSKRSASHHWLIRAKKNIHYTLIEEHSKGDAIVELAISNKASKSDPSLPQSMRVRLLCYTHLKGKVQYLLTSLLDPKAYPAKEVIALYHERWELETSYDELKTHMLEREETLRSQRAEGVAQELWGILIAYNLVRKEMLHVAKENNLTPTRISFRHCLQAIRLFCTVEAWNAAPGNLAKRLSEFHQMLTLFILPKRRSERAYKRHVKIKQSPYPKNPGKPISKALYA